MRLFAAIPLSDELKKAVMGTLHDLKKEGIKGSYVPVQNLYLILTCIGEADDLPAVKEALKKVSFKPFKLSFSEMGASGDQLRVGIKGNQGLSAAVKSIRDALDAAGIEYDRKEFTPQITLVSKVSGNWKRAAAPKGQMMVKKISLMKTTVKNGKQEYSEIFSF